MKIRFLQHFSGVHLVALIPIVYILGYVGFLSWASTPPKGGPGLRDAYSISVYTGNEKSRKFAAKVFKPALIAHGKITGKPAYIRNSPAD